MRRSALEFEGFLTARELWAGSTSLIPDAQGVYLVLRASIKPPVFLATSPAGWVKGKDPTVSTSVLSENWVEGVHVLYIGKAGGQGSGAGLRSRLKQYLGNGRGGKHAHRGGQYIWQLADASELIFCWKETPEEDPEEVEGQMIAEFRQAHGKRPFANRKG